MDTLRRIGRFAVLKIVLERFSEVEKPYKYWFVLNSRFFNCRTGYTLKENGIATTLSMDLVADNPRVREKIYWFLVKPVHALLANKVLRVIKKEVEEVR